MSNNLSSDFSISCQSCKSVVRVALTRIGRFDPSVKTFCSCKRITVSDGEMHLSSTGTILVGKSFI